MTKVIVGRNETAAIGWFTVIWCGLTPTLWTFVIVMAE
jgi:hypothetical protein